MPEQLWWMRRGGPGRAAAATGSRGATTPQARCPTPRPAAARISDTRATCSGDPPCDAQAEREVAVVEPEALEHACAHGGQCLQRLGRRAQEDLLVVLAVGQPPHEAVLALDAPAAFDDDPAAAQATTESAPGQTPKTASAVSPM